jgi:Ca2+-binding RTX toxin-like protein
MGNAATYATVADFNEDGKKDLAVAAYLNGVPVLLGKGDGTFGAAQNAGFYRAFSVTSSDFDADGNIDLAASDVGSDRVSVSRGNGDGTFGVPQTFQVAPDVRSVIGTDFDGDQIADLAVANHSSSSVSVLLNTTTPGTTPDTTAPSVTLSTPSDGATYDLNQAITANYSCHDEAQGSGVASCQGTVPDGSPVDTATLGTKSFTVTTSDNAGNVSSVTHTYTVVGAGQCTITGNAKANTISGTSGADIICGGGGNDTIKGLGGNDVLRGDAGNDKLFGGAGDDVVNSKDGVNGNDSLDGGTGTDTKVTDATEKSIVGFP